MLLRVEVLRILERTNTLVPIQRMGHRIRQVVAERPGRLRDLLRRTSSTSPPRPRLRSAAVRHDPVPPLAPFPRARYVFMVDSIPDGYGGRSASILSKARLLKEHAGIGAEIVMMNYSGDLDQLTRLLRDRGALVEGMTLTKIQDYEAPGPRARRKINFNSLRRVHAQLDNLVGDDNVFITVEARNVDHLLLTYQNPNVRQLYVLHNPHTKAPHHNPQRIQRAYRPLLDRHATVGATVFLTNTQRADAEATLGRQPNFVVIPHPALPATLDPDIQCDPGLVVMMARLDHVKRLDDAIKVFVQVLEQVPGARLEIYGLGPERAPLQRQIDSLGIGASVTLAGYTTSPGKVYQRAALSLLTSRHEGLPLVLLESLSHGCPAISYDLKYGPSDLITDGVDGILVEEANISAMAHEVIRVLSDHALRQRLSHAALSSADKFGPDVFIARWSALFNDLAPAAWHSP